VAIVSNLLLGLSLLALWTIASYQVHGCGPGPGYGIRPRPRKLTAMHYKQFSPNFSENNLGASGRAEGKITRNSDRFNELVCNYNPDIVFKDEENTNADRFMTKRCKDCLNRLAIAVMNQWPGVHLRVTEAWDEDGHHPSGSLHYEGRAVDITTDDRETDKYGLLAQLAVEAGFDWVHYESKYHIHCSVKAGRSLCGGGEGWLFPRLGLGDCCWGEQRLLSSLHLGDKVLTLSGTGQLIFSPVILFLHQNSLSWTTFISVETKDGHRLDLTPHHLLFTAPHSGVPYTEYQAQFSSRVKVGDYVLIHKLGGQVTPSRIISVSLKESLGVYAPLTDDGTLFVNGILASSYALVEDHKLAHWAFGPIRAIFSFNQLLWGETARTYNTTETMNTSVFLTKSLVSQQNRQSAPQGLTIKWCPLYREVSNIHWYAQLLYKFGFMFLDSSVFHP
uniref:Hedgehog protein n=1 Tax=Neogobius melanostomus TaxID=47308 RepID=A0A8C6T085_9GOBI